MKYPVLLVAGLFFAGFSPPGFAEPPASAPPPAVEAKIKALDEEERRAILAGDVPTLERLWSPDIIVNNPQNGITPTREALLQRVREGKIHYASFERHIEAMRTSGDDLVIVMGAEQVVPAAPAPGAGQIVSRRFTDLWRLRGGNWTLIARHANIISNVAP